MSKKRTPHGGPNNQSGAHLPALIDPVHLQALAHVVRQHILLATVLAEVSPNEMSKALDVPLSNVSYHCHVLKEAGMIEVARTEPRRGAVEHYYRATAESLFPAKVWRRVKEGLRAAVGGGQASEVFNDLAAALKAGKLRDGRDRIARSALVLDPEGQRKVQAIADRATEEAEAEQQAAAQRMAEANGDGSAAAYTFAVLAFSAAWEPVDLHAVQAANAERRKPKAKGKGKRAAAAE